MSSKMPSLTLQKTEIKKIAIFRALQLGDMLCSIPAIRALRAAWPEAEIVLLGLPWAKSLVERFSVYIDRFIWFPGYPGLPEQEFSASVFHAFTSKMIDEEFDLVIQMQGNGTVVNPMVELFGAKLTAGFCKPGVYAPANGLFMEYPEDRHEVLRHIKLMEFLGVPALGHDLEFPLRRKDHEDLQEAALSLEEHEYVCIHPGSRGLMRRWPPEFFAKLADEAAEHGFTPVITGTSEEMEIVNEVVSHMTHTPVIAAGRTSMGAVSVLIGQSRGLLSNCTGVSHIAAALKTPSVVVSLDGEPERWGPMNRELHEVIDWTTQPDFDLVHRAVLNMLKTKG